MSAQASSTRRIDLGEGIWAEVVKDFYNPLIKRRELHLKIHHVMKPTPMRINLRLAISERFGTPIERVYVRSIQTEYGIGRSHAVIHIYDTVDRALSFEPKYVIERNGGVNPFEEEE
ncbi:MAG: 30S ribosomal protein S24e [Desulfurococcales archaeon]|nr:30S ribosomal protein S24e [Desulfurococcales archaeon]